MTTGIYKITCISNNKIYIGSSKDIEKRITNHFTSLKKKNHKNPHLQSAYNLYGENSFAHEIIQICRIEELLNAEQFWMDETKCYDREIGFNNCKKSDRPLGYKHTEENKLRMSLIKRGKKQAKEHIEKRSKANLGKRRSEEFKKKLSIARLGENNPRFGAKEDKELTLKRMKNMLGKPRWNKGLTKDIDPRLNKLASWKGKHTVNSLKCLLINIITGEGWEGESLIDLSKKCPISLPSIHRLKNNMCGKKFKKTYILKIL